MVLSLEEARLTTLDEMRLAFGNMCKYDQIQEVFYLTCSIGFFKFEVLLLVDFTDALIFFMFLVID